MRLTFVSSIVLEGGLAADEGRFGENSNSSGVGLQGMSMRLWSARQNLVK